MDAWCKSQSAWGMDSQRYFPINITKMTRAECLPGACADSGQGHTVEQVREFPMKRSAHNTLSGSVTEVAPGAVTARVRINVRGITASDVMADKTA